MNGLIESITIDDNEYANRDIWPNVVIRYPFIESFPLHAYDYIHRSHGLFPAQVLVGKYQ